MASGKYLCSHPSKYSGQRNILIASITSNTLSERPALPSFISMTYSSNVYPVPVVLSQCSVFSLGSMVRLSYCVWCCFLLEIKQLSLVGKSYQSDFSWGKAAHKEKYEMSKLAFLSLSCHELDISRCNIISYRHAIRIYFVTVSNCHPLKSHTELAFPDLI